MFALSASGADVIVAGIAAVGSMVAAFIAVRGHRDIRSRIGSPNGSGNVVEMQERQMATTARLLDLAGQGIEGQTHLREQLRKVDASQEAHALLDTQRFKDIFQHLDIPYDYQDERHTT